MLVSSKFKECVRINLRSWVGLEIDFLILCWGNHRPQWGGDTPWPKTRSHASCSGKPHVLKSLSVVSQEVVPREHGLSLVLWIWLRRGGVVWRLFTEAMQHPDVWRCKFSLKSFCVGTWVMMVAAVSSSPSVIAWTMCSGPSEHPGTSIAVLGSIQVRNQKHRDSKWLVGGHTVIGFRLFLVY